ncbi:MAG: NUDIX domain-containing protein, partial [Bacteroidota bacterium]
MPQPNYSLTLTIDCVVFGFSRSQLHILLQTPSVDHAKGQWKLPGGFANVSETTQQTAHQTLQRLTGIKDVFLEQLHTFDALDRFPDERRITVAYYALIRPEDYELSLGPTSQKVKWFPFPDIPPLAYDHNQIAEKGLQRLQKDIRNQPVGFELLPEKFTLSDLQGLYEAILSVKLDKSNFRRKILRMNLLIPLEEHRKALPHRAARLFRFDTSVY